MSKFTKEQLINWADRLIEETYSDIEISRTDAHAESYHAQLSLLQLARTALTSSMEQEPVGEVVLGDYDDCGDHPDAKVVCIAAQGQAEWSNFSNGTKLYAAPQLPQPTVPDELTREEYRRRFMMEDNFNDTYRGGWNACRAAMLQLYGNSEQLNSPVTPDGWIPVSERMPDDDTYAVAADIAHEEIYGAFAAWFIHGRFSVMEGLSASNYDGGAIIEIDTPITHWMPLPVAPQQK